MRWPRASSRRSIASGSTARRWRRTPRRGRPYSSFVEGWYNRRRRYSALGYVAPLVFEKQASGAAPSVDTAGPMDALRAPTSPLDHVRRGFDRLTVVRSLTTAGFDAHRPEARRTPANAERVGAATAPDEGGESGHQAVLIQPWPTSRGPRIPPRRFTEVSLQRVGAAGNCQRVCLRRRSVLGGHFDLNPIQSHREAR